MALNKSRADWNFTLKVEINGDPFENLIYYYISQPFGWQPILPSASLSVLLGRAVHCDPVKTTSIVCPHFTCQLAFVSAKLHTWWGKTRKMGEGTLAEW